MADKDKSVFEVIKEEFAKKGVGFFFILVGVAILIVILLAIGLRPDFNNGVDVGIFGAEVSFRKSTPYATDIAPVPTMTPMPTTTPIPTIVPTSVLDETPPSSVLFEADFEDGSTDDIEFDDGNWNVVEDDLDNKVLELNNKNSSHYPIARIGSSSWTNYRMECRFKLKDFVSDTPHSGVVFLSVRDNYKISSSINSWQVFAFAYGADGSWEDPIEIDYRFQPETWYSVRAEVNGSNIKVFLDEELMVDIEDERTDAGRVWLQSGTNTVVQFDDIRITSF